MDLLSAAAGYISAAFVESKKTREFKDDFLAAFIDWIRPIFLKDDPKLVEALETHAKDGKTQGRLEGRLEDLLKDESFRKQLEEWMNKPGWEKLREKNILKAGKLSGGNLNLGDGQTGTGNYDRKNILEIEDGNFTGDINIGDGLKQ